MKKDVKAIVDALNGIDRSPDVYLDHEKKAVVVQRQPGIKVQGYVDCVVNYMHWKRVS